MSLDSGVGSSSNVSVATTISPVTQNDDISYRYLEYIFTQGNRRKSNLIYTIEEEQYYRFNEHNKDCDAYKCVDCNSRVHLRNGGILIQKKRYFKHTHLSKASKFDQLAVLNEVKEKCADISTIINEKKQSVRDIFYSVLSKYPNLKVDFTSSLQRNLQLIRTSALPKNPYNGTEIAKMFESEKVMNLIGISKTKSIFFDGVIEASGPKEDDNYSACFFSSKDSLDIFEQNVPYGERNIVIDGTFDVVPLGTYKQLLVVYAVYMEKVFPIIYVLMDRKTEKAYKAVFNFIDAKIFDLTGTKRFYTDFEMAIRNALKKKYKHSKFSTCHFHFAQAVRKRATQINGFIDFITENDAARKIYYKLIYLPLLPPENIDAIFHTLRIQAFQLNKAAFEQIFQYYDRQWIKKEGARRISVFNREMRTTSAAEGYNRALGAYCTKKGSFIWFCVSIRNQEFMKSKEFGSFVESGGLIGLNQKKDDKVRYFISKFRTVSIDFILTFHLNFLKDRAIMIRESFNLIKTKQLTPSQFLDRILHITKKFNDESGIMAIKAVEEGNPETSLNETDHGEHQNEPEKQTQGICIACKLNQCQIILVPCYHIVICKDCWNDRVKAHERHCGNTYKDKRKKNADMKKVTCPCCDNIVANAAPFYMATIDS